MPKGPGPLPTNSLATGLPTTSKPKTKNKAQNPYKVWPIFIASDRQRKLYKLIDKIRNLCYSVNIDFPRKEIIK
jgi:hypothetical protein